MAELPLMRWDAPGPYLAAFSTRVGGVSGAPFDTLNLGKLTADDPGHVAENRARLCAEAETEPELLCFGRQVHGPAVRRARGQGEPGDGLWTDDRGKPLLVFTADCLPVAVARANGDAPAIAALHVGWRGLLGGIVQTAVLELGGGPLAAVIGPGIGPCCYEVGGDVGAPFRARFGEEIVRDVLQPRALLLTSARRRTDGPPGPDRLCHLTRSARATGGSARRSGRA